MTTTQGKLRVLTCNVPEAYVLAMDKLSGDGGIYPSRSELIRVALRSFLIEEIAKIDDFTKLSPKNKQIGPIDPIVPKEQNLMEIGDFQVIEKNGQMYLRVFK